MANKEWTANFYADTAAKFYNTTSPIGWTNSISNALDEVGMVKLYTSAVDLNTWTTVNNERFFEVWRLPSSVGMPELYVRIGYGQATYSSTYSYPRMNVRVGSSYNGSGVVTGLSDLNNSEIFASTGASALNGSVKNYLSCDGNGFALVLNAENLANGSGTYYYGKNALIVDRFRDENGEPLDYGALFISMNPYNGTRWCSYDLNENDGYLIPGSSFAPCATRGYFSSTSEYKNAYGQTQIYPWWFAVRSGHGLSKMICTYAYADRLPYQNEPVAWLDTSVSRVIRTVGPTNAGLDLVTSGNYYPAYAIWWDDI